MLPNKHVSASWRKTIHELAADIHAAQIRLGDVQLRLLFPSEESPSALSNGRDLSNWEGDSKYWSVEADGTIRGANEEPVPSSTYLFSKQTFREFRLIFEVRQTMSSQHSTIAFPQWRLWDSVSMTRAPIPTASGVRS